MDWDGCALIYASANQPLPIDGCWAIAATPYPCGNHSRSSKLHAKRRDHGDAIPRPRLVRRRAQWPKPCDDSAFASQSTRRCEGEFIAACAPCSPLPREAPVPHYRGNLINFLNAKIPVQTHLSRPSLSAGRGTQLPAPHAWLGSRVVTRRRPNRCRKGQAARHCRGARGALFRAGDRGRASQNAGRTQAGSSPARTTPSCWRLTPMC